MMKCADTSADETKDNTQPPQLPSLPYYRVVHKISADGVVTWVTLRFESHRAVAELRKLGHIIEDVEPVFQHQMGHTIEDVEKYFP
jgi:hypothetical protein